MTLAHDAGTRVGLGHQRRCRAVATAITARGAVATLVPLGEGAKPEHLDALDGDAILIDSYRLRADARTQPAAVLAAIDDLGRDLEVDLLIEPAPLVGDAPRRARSVLRGFEHALVDPTIATSARAAPRAEVEVVLVAAGASSAASAIAGRIAAEIARDLPTASVVVAAAGATAGSPDAGPAIRWLPARPSLVQALLDADLVVTAAGVTALEAVALGRPTVVFTMADNQHATYHGLVGAGAAEAATQGSAAAIAVALAVDIDHRRDLAARGPRVVDGRGAERVAAALLARSQ